MKNKELVKIFGVAIIIEFILLVIFSIIAVWAKPTEFNDLTIWCKLFISDAMLLFGSVVFYAYFDSNKDVD